MRAFFLAACLLLALSTSLSQAQIVQRIDIIDFGIYTATETGRVPDPGRAGGEAVTITNLTHVQSTNIVPGRIGSMFGFRYRMVGVANATVKLNEAMRVPEPGFHNPKTGNKILTDAELAERKVGENYSFTYALDEPWEILPGTWIFEIWDGDRKLISQSFTVVKQ